MKKTTIKQQQQQQQNIKKHIFIEIEIQLLPCITSKLK